MELKQNKIQKKKKSAITIASTTAAICLEYTDDFIILGIVLTMFRITAIKTLLCPLSFFLTPRLKTLAL